MTKEIYVDKAKINKIGTIFFAVSFFLMLISGIVLILNTTSTDRFKLIGWLLLGIAGYWLYGKFKLLVYSKIKKSKKKPKKKREKVDKIVNQFGILFFIFIILDFVAGFYLYSSSLSNWLFILIYTALFISLVIILFAIIILSILSTKKVKIRKLLKEIKNRKKKEVKKNE